MILALLFLLSSSKQGTFVIPFQRCDRCISHHHSLETPKEPPSPFVREERERDRLRVYLLKDEDNKSPRSLGKLSKQRPANHSSRRRALPPLSFPRYNAGQQNMSANITASLFRTEFILYISSFSGELGAKQALNLLLKLRTKTTLKTMCYAHSFRSVWTFPSCHPLMPFQFSFIPEIPNLNDQRQVGLDLTQVGFKTQSSQRKLHREQ